MIHIHNSYTYYFMIKMIQLFFCYFLSLQFLMMSFKFTVFTEQVHPGSFHDT